MNLVDRVSEEEHRVVVDIRCTMNYFSELYESLLTDFNASMCTIERAQLVAKLVHLHKYYMRDLWKVAFKHIQPVPPMPQCNAETLHILDTVKSESTDDAEYIWLIWTIIQIQTVMKILLQMTMMINNSQISIARTKVCR